MIGEFIVVKVWTNVKVSFCGSNFLPAPKWNYPSFSISLLRCGAEQRDKGGLKVVRIKHSILVNGVGLFSFTGRSDFHQSYIVKG